MSHKTSLRVWEHSQTQRAARCLMLALADFANDDGIAWPGTVLLSKKINETPDYTDIIIKKCIKLGELEKYAGSGRGHPSRFAILCGLSPDEQKRLKGVLQRGYSSTPIKKGGTAKGVLSENKGGTFSDANNHANGASESAETPLPKNKIHGGDPRSESPPPALPPISSGGGGGGDSYETEVRALLGGYNILGAANVATKYAALDTRPPIAVIETAVLSMAGSDPNIPSRIYRRLMDRPPPWPEVRAVAKSAPLQATRPNLPDTTVAPAEMLRQLRERNAPS